MEDRKLTAIRDYFITAMGLSPLYMWFAVPGGMITGKPISEKEYYDLMTDGTVVTIVDMSPDQPTRFFYLKDVRLALGPALQTSRTAIIDGLDVSAWGFINVNANNVSQ